MERQEDENCGYFRTIPHIYGVGGGGGGGREGGFIQSKMGSVMNVGRIFTHNVS